MPVKVYAGTDVMVNDDGFFDDPERWREEMAPQIAREAGIETLTPQHWKIVEFMRHEYADKGTGPSVRALSMTNGARAEGIEANLFFTFFGLDAIHRVRHEHIKLATVGNPGLHLATWAGGLPGVSSVMTHYMAHKMGELDIPPIPEFLEMIADTGAGLYACKASVDLFGLTREDFIDQVKDIITVGEFYELAAGGQIIFT